MPWLPLSAVPPGSEVLLDANVLVYAVLGTSRQCVELIDDCISGEVVGFVTVEVLGEACHRLMLAEARRKKRP